ncbi:hypothetical protein E1A91_A02G092000v1 [Gossypium mustelinum]|uniref:Uncharacterized protein n=1 Tax=Gossypium mustelinum TaxID=34275 RepID=A0A5D3A732_GOSMU|nr:hypothetical protein E1A91_A02G092000v1 [Gossypium mustelinum]
MVAATLNPKHLGGTGLLPPLLPSDPHNSIPPPPQNSRKCLSTSSSHSNSSTKHTTSSAIKRSQPVERRHAVTPPSNKPMRLKTDNANNNTADKVSKATPAPSPCPTKKETTKRRKPTLETRRTEQTEISKTERWPARLRLPNSVASRSMACTDERKRLNGSVNGNVVGPLQDFMADNRDIRAVTPVESKAQRGLAASDTESVSSGSTSGSSQSSSANVDVKRGPPGIMVSARSWQQTANRVCRSHPGSPVPKKNTARTKLIVPDKFGADTPFSSPNGVLNSRGQLPPIHGPVRPASPSKLGSSSTRGMSPRLRNGLDDNLVTRLSILSFVGDGFKIGENKVSDANLLRLLHNRWLQWRFVNARADATLSSQRSNAEKSLHNAWTTTSKLRESVRAKRTELQLLRQTLKLISILKGHMIFLDEWAILDHDYCSSLSGATEALMASMVRLPVVCGARVDVPKLQDAICSAVDLLQATTLSIHSLVSKVAKVNCLASELGNLSSNEVLLLYQCKELLSAVASMQQVKECSLRTHISQQNRLPSTFDNTIGRLF